DRLLDVADLQLDIELDCAPDLDADAFAPDGGKPLQRVRYGVIAEREVFEGIQPLCVGDFDRRAADPGRAGGFHRDAYQHRPGIVLDEAPDAAGRRLRPCVASTDHQHPQGENCGNPCAADRAAPAIVKPPPGRRV